MTSAEATSFTVHGLKHFSITAAAQLGVPPDTLRKMGHWAPNSGMPDRYIQTKCTVELAGRAEVSQAIRQGWSVVPDGHVPEPKPAAPVQQAATLSLRVLP